MSERIVIEHLGLVVTKTQTRPTRPGKQPRDVWEVDGMVNGLEGILYDLGGKKWKGKFSFWEDPTEQLQKIDAEERLGYAEQIERKHERAAERADRLSDRAAKHQQVANSARDAASQIASFIPMGQPILVGHHSEGRHRRDLARIDSNMRKSIDASDYAAHLRGRAAHNEKVAAGEYSKPYVVNRIKEAQADVRRCDRHLADKKSCEQYPDWAGRIKVLREQAQQKEAYWLDYLKQNFGDESLDKMTFGKHNVKPGDWITSRWGWTLVVRSNAKSASVKHHSATQSWNDTVPWEEVRKHMTAAEWEQYDGEKVKHPSMNWYSLVPNKQEGSTDEA